MYLNLYLVSDSTGESLEAISKSILYHFSDISINKSAWFLTKRVKQIENIIEEAQHNPGIIMYNFLDGELAQTLQSKCKELKIPCISPVSYVVSEFSRFLGIETTPHPEKTTIMNETYFEKMEAINFTVAHDDGALTSPESLNEADIIIIGPSRVSKSPVSIYLSYKGYKVINIPFIAADLMPDLSECKAFRVVFSINPERLQRIRANRIDKMVAKGNSYVDLDTIKQEILNIKRYALSLAVPVIDTTDKSVEETSVRILNLMKR